VKNSGKIPVDLIAPCGMNCSLCWGFIREKNSCPGCLRIEKQETQKSKHRTTCIIRDCEHLAESKSRYCSTGCEKFPCARLKQLDKRYRAKYGMSMLENLRFIEESGIRNFVQSEKKKWMCPECGEKLCVHKPDCLFCSYTWNPLQQSKNV
jgi:hypothetical protein